MGIFSKAVKRMTEKSKFDVVELNALGVGEYLTQRFRLVNVQADDSDFDVRKKLIVVPTGFEILEARVHIVSADEGWCIIDSIEQPGYIGVDHESFGNVSATINEVAEVMDDKKSASALKIIASSLSFSTVINSTTHGRIKWSAHAEGHKYKGDGHIRADLEVTLIRGPMQKDIQFILLQMAKMAFETSNEQVKDLIGQIEAMSNYSVIKQVSELAAKEGSKKSGDSKSKEPPKKSTPPKKEPETPPEKKP